MWRQEEGATSSDATEKQTQTYFAETMARWWKKMPKNAETARKDSNHSVTIRQDSSLPNSALKIQMPSTKPPKSDSDGENDQSETGR